MTPERSLEVLFEIATAETEFDLECAVKDAIGRFDPEDVESCIYDASRKMRDNVMDALRSGPSGDDVLSSIDWKASRILEILDRENKGE